MAMAVARVGDIPIGGVKEVDVDGAAIALANLDGKFYAVDNLCPHRGCSLATGTLAGNVLTCPCHGSQFDITSGAVIRGPASIGVASYPVDVAGDRLHVATTAPAAVETSVSSSTAVPPASSSEAPRPSQLSGASVLAKVPLFSDIGQTSLQGLEAFAFRRTFPAGEMIVEEGHTGNGLFVVISGQVEVVKGLGTERVQTIGVLGPGEPFGEMALLGDWKRSASVRAIDEVECLGLDRWVFLSYLSTEPQFAIKMLQMLAQRLAETGQKLIE